MRKAFDDSINKIHGDSIYFPDNSPDPDLMSLSYLDDEDEDPVNISYENPVDATGKVIYENPFTDILIHTEGIFPQGNNFPSAKVQGRTEDYDGNIVGTFESNPI